MTRTIRWGGITIAVCIFAVAAALSAPGAAAQDNPWFVVRAVYGYGSRQIDVTDLLRDLISRGGVNGRVAVNNQTMGGDPAIGRDKTLRIFARNRADQEHEFDFAEGSFVPAQMFVVPDRDWGRHDDRDRGRDSGYRGDRDNHRDNEGFRGRDRHQIEIVCAFYGVQRHSADVTGLLQNMVEDGRLNVPVSNRSMGGDPAVGANKMLIVVYRYDGTEHAAAVGEGGVLSVP